MWGSKSNKTKYGNVEIGDGRTWGERAVRITNPAGITLTTNRNISCVVKRGDMYTAILDNGVEVFVHKQYFDQLNEQGNFDD